MYKQNEYPHISPQDLSPDRNILNYNPYIANQINPQPSIKPFVMQDISQKTQLQLQQPTALQKRTSSPQPRQHYAPTPTVIHYPRQNPVAQQGEGAKRIEKVWVQNENISNQEKQKIIGGLKEHFDRVVRGLTDQMNFELRRRDEDIKKLEKRLKDNENELIGKEREIGRLKELQEMGNNSSKGQQKNDKISLKGKQVEDLQKNFEYLTGKIRDIDAKVKHLIECFASNAKQAKVLTKMQQKVGGFLEEFLKIETKKVYGLNLRVFQFLSSKDSLVVALEKQVHIAKQTVISQNNPSKVNMSVYDQKLSSMKRELDGLQKTVQYIGDRQTKTQFDPVKLEKLERQMAKLQERSKANQYNVNWSAVDQCEKQYKAVLTRINKVYGDLHTRKNQSEGFERAAGHLKTTPKKESKRQKQEWQDRQQRHQRYQPPQIKPLKQKKISAPQQPTNSNALYFSYHDSTSDVQHFNDSDEQTSYKSKMSEKLLRLIQIIRTSRKSMPLKVVIDETGYLKERETGAYLFDRNGVLFELQEDELDDAVRRRVIRI